MRLASKLVVIAVLSLAACGHKKPEGGGGEGTAAPKSLYDRLGGKDAITVVVDDFVTNVAGDARINKFFTAAAGDPNEMNHFKEMLVDQICNATGGPCEYKGKSMPEAHKGMGITHEDFTALVEDLKKSLDAHDVPAQEQSELLGALGPLEPDIVGK
ncbi:MAG TPA: group 1 truncated hemoglobin [Kofleriaceae bacterium]|jgi:hemoglobin|nr:group 1 truncated hemoglobin [Kofleriaceae bacterium]